MVLFQDHIDLADQGSMSLLIDTTLCIECGVDTSFNGYVNRVPNGRTNFDCYTCGPCSDTLSADSDEDKDDFPAYIVERCKEVDKVYPYAAIFRYIARWDEDCWHVGVNDLMQIILAGHQAMIDGSHPLPEVYKVSTPETITQRVRLLGGRGIAFPEEAV